jgi:hypothetical protein
MTLIDDKGAASIVKWLDSGKKYDPQTFTILTETPIDLHVKNDSEEATLRLILMRNGLKFTINKFCEN